MAALLVERRRTKQERVEIVTSTSESVIKVYPGEERRLSVSVVKPVRAIVHIAIKGLPSTVARAVVSPIEGEVPFTAYMEIKVLEDALPGVYFFELAFTRQDTGFSTTRPLVLVVLPRRKPQLVVDERAMVEVGRELYETVGPSMTIYWYLLNLLFHGVKLVEFQRVYEFHKGIAGVASENATLKVLRRLELYGLVERISRGVYRLLPVPLPVALNAIDRRRVRTREQVLRLNNERGVEGSSDGRLPHAVTRVLSKAQELVKTDSLWKAVDLLAHTVLPVRETGALLAWVKDSFVYFESKDSKTHLLHSHRLADLLRQLGVREGDMTKHKQSEASDIIREMFGSHDNARRVHYLLKQLGWFTTPPHARYFYEILFTPQPVLVVYVLDDDMERRVLFKTQLTYLPPGMPDKGPVVPFEHVNPENEETYFHRAKGWITRAR